MQTKVCSKFFYTVWEEATHKPSKEAAAKNFSSSVYVTGTTYFDVFYFKW